MRLIDATHTIDGHVLDEIFDDKAGLVWGGDAFKIGVYVFHSFFSYMDRLGISTKSKTTCVRGTGATRVAMSVGSQAVLLGRDSPRRRNILPSSRIDHGNELSTHPRVPPAIDVMLVVKSDISYSLLRESVGSAPA